MLVTAVMVAMLLSTACARIPAPSAGPSGSAAVPSGGGRWVELVRTGGYAGVHDQVTIDIDGHWNEENRIGRRRTGDLNPAALERLRVLAADPQLAREAEHPRGTTKCRDAFNYTATIAAPGPNGRTLTLSYVECPTDPAYPATGRSVVQLITRSVFTNPNPRHGAGSGSSEYTPLTSGPAGGAR